MKDRVLCGKFFFQNSYSPPPSLQVTSLALLFDGSSKPTQGAAPLLVADADAVAVVERAGMSLDASAGGGLAQEQPAGAPQQRADPYERLAMSVPWGAGQPLKQGALSKALTPIGLEWLTN